MGTIDHPSCKKGKPQVPRFLDPVNLLHRIAAFHPNTVAMSSESWSLHPTPKSASRKRCQRWKGGIILGVLDNRMVAYPFNTRLKTLETCQFAWKPIGTRRARVEDLFQYLDHLCHVSHQ